MNKTIQINEIFLSLQGESSFAGRLCVFVRLHNCNLRCNWCDTKYAQSENEPYSLMSLEEIETEIKKYNCNFIEFTGGEPLLQPEILPLLDKLQQEGFTVAIETNGSIDISSVAADIIKIIDLKCPSSGMTEFINFDNLNFLSETDQIKFVVLDRFDYEWAKTIISERNLLNITREIILSPVFRIMNPRKLAEWIIEDKLNVRMQIQLHKYIWDPETRGV